MSTYVSAGSGGPPAPAGVLYANQYPSLAAACTAGRALFPNGVCKVILDATAYTLPAPLNVWNIWLQGQVRLGTIIQVLSDWAAALPVNSMFALDQRPSVPLGAPTQNNPSQASGSSAYTAGQVVSSWITASNSRNGGETPVSGIKQITIATNGNQPTFNLAAISGVDSTTTYNIYLSRTGSTDPTTAIKVASGVTGTSYTDTTGTGGSGHPPTTDSTGGVGIQYPDINHFITSPLWGTWLSDITLTGPGAVTKGVVTAHLSGIRLGGNCATERVNPSGFFAGQVIYTDKEAIFGPAQAGGNYYGVYFSQPAPSQGDQIISDVELDGAGWASIAVASGMSINNAVIDAVHLGSGPFGVYKEQALVGDVIMNDCTWRNCAFESCGNGVIFANGTVSNFGGTVENTEFIGTGSNGLDSTVTIPTTTQDAYGTAIGRKNAVIDLGAGNWQDNDISGSDPALISANQITSAIACANFNSGGSYRSAGPAIDLAAANSKQWAVCSGSMDSIVWYYATQCLLAFSADSGVLLGDLLMAATSGSQVSVKRSVNTKKCVGVAMHALSGGGNGLLFARSGKVNIRCGTNTIAFGDALVPDNTGQTGCVMTASALTAGNIVGVALAASSGGLVSALLQL